METCTNLLHTFYKNMSKDVQNLFCSFPLTSSSCDELAAIFQQGLDLDLLGRLCRLGKAVDKSLISGKPLTWSESYGSLWPSSTRAPYVFRDLFEAVFGISLRPLSPALPKEVQLLRQLLLAFSKLKDVEPEIDIEDEVSLFVKRILDIPAINLDTRILRIARNLLRAVFYDNGSLAPEFHQWLDEPFGKHGPGAVADGEVGRRKWEFFCPPGFDERIFHLLPGERVYDWDASDHKGSVSSRLAVVPKDFRGHRLICIEPKEFMFFQQGLAQIITDRVHSLSLTHEHIDFNDQNAPFRLSRDQMFSTIDLKDASDRVSKQLCRLLFPKDVFAMLTRARARGITYNGQVLVPNHNTMFTMGNALCFPIETLVFWALTLATCLLEEDISRPGTLDSFFRYHIRDGFPQRWWQGNSALCLATQVRVFGDDIICRNRFFSPVIATLESAGFVVNTEKSCHDTPVRESCGSWWYSGTDARITKFSYSELSEPRVWLGWFSQAKDLHDRGFIATSFAILNLCDQYHSVPGGYLGYPPKDDWNITRRWNSQLQRVEVLLPFFYTKGTERLAGRPGYYAWFTNQSTINPTMDDMQCVKIVWTDIANIS